MDEDFEFDKKISELKKIMQLLDDRVVAFSDKLEKSNIDDNVEGYPGILEALKATIKN
jgi:hypothetical protein